MNLGNSLDQSTSDLENLDENSSLELLSSEFTYLFVCERTTGAQSEFNKFIDLLKIKISDSNEILAYYKKLILLQRLAAEYGYESMSHVYIKGDTTLQDIDKYIEKVKNLMQKKVLNNKRIIEISSKLSTINLPIDRDSSLYNQLKKVLESEFVYGEITNAGVILEAKYRQLDITPEEKKERYSKASQNIIDIIYFIYLSVYGSDHIPVEKDILIHTMGIVSRNYYKDFDELEVSNSTVLEVFLRFLGLNDEEITKVDIGSEGFIESLTELLDLSRLENEYSIDDIMTITRKRYRFGLPVYKP